MAEQNARQRTKLLPSMNLVLIVQAASHQVQPTVQHVKAGKTHFLKWDPISNKGEEEEILGYGTDIHHGSGEESNQEL